MQHYCRFRCADRNINQRADAGCHTASQRVLCADAGYHRRLVRQCLALIPSIRAAACGRGLRPDFDCHDHPTGDWGKAQRRPSDIPQLQPLEPRLLLSGTQYVVDSLLDTVADDGMITLREAIEAANSNTAVYDAPAGSAAEPDSITFAPELAGQTITLAGTQLEITDSLNITGPTEKITLDADGKSSVITITDETTEVNLNGLIVINSYRGGIVNSGVLNVYETEVTNNRGSGIINEFEATMYLHDVIIDRNSGGGRGYIGGGIYNAGAMVLENTSVLRNIARKGGGIYNESYCELSIINSKICGNAVSGSKSHGGGIYSDNYSLLNITNTVIAGNTAEEDGGGIYYRSRQSIIRNTTIVSNSAGDRGGGIHNHWLSSPTVNNSIVALNESPLYNDVDPYWPISNYNTNLVGITPRFVRDPSPGVDGVWGTDDDDYGDLRLTGKSLAIDRGDHHEIGDFNGMPVTFDLDGAPRIIGNQVDCGAYEYQGLSPVWEQPSAVVTTNSDIVDPTDNLISLREAIFHNPLLKQTITFDTSLANQTITLNARELLILDSLEIDATSIGGITINANYQSRVIFITGLDTEVYLKNLTLIGGKIKNTGRGAGIHCDRISLTLTNSTISGNMSNDFGGGIYSTAGELNIINSIVSNNSAQQGGGIYSVNSPTVIINTTVTSNFASWHNGGIYYFGDNALQLKNSIVALNHAPTDADISGDFTDQHNLFAIDPTFVHNPSPGPDNQWGTADDDLGDLRLSGSSLALNAGFNNWAFGIDDKPIATDINGNPRIIQGQVDLGAYEFQSAPSSYLETPSTLVSTVADIVNATDGLISLREAIHYSKTLDQNITFAPNLTGKTVILQAGQLYICHSLEIDATSVAGLTINAEKRSRIMTIYGENTVVSLNNLTLTGGNSTLNGGALHNHLATLNLTNMTVIGNLADNPDDSHQSNYGGGVYNDSGVLKVLGSSIAKNRSAYSGGGIYNNQGELTVIKSIISGNSATGGWGGSYSNHGGGIFNNSNDSILKLINSVVVGNHAGRDGGGIYLIGSLEVINSTIAGNSGRGIDMYNDPVKVINSIISLNTPNTPAKYFSHQNSIIVTDPLFIRNPDDGGDGWCDKPWTIDIDESANDDYGDLRLHQNSPAIDAGFYDETIPLTDFLGRPRHDDPAITNTGSGTIDYIDIGAYEAQYPLPILNADFNNDGSVGLADLDILGDNWGLASNATKEQGDANNDGRVSLLDLDILGRTFGAGPMTLPENPLIYPSLQAAGTPAFHTLDNLFDSEGKEQWELVI